MKPCQVDGCEREFYAREYCKLHYGRRPVEPCRGCVTDADRALWLRLADEVDAYLSHDEEAGLFA